MSPSTQIVAPLARWSSRIALFAASLLVAGLVLHRLAGLPTPVALNLFAVAFGGACLAVLVALIATIQIWRRGYGGAGSVAIGVLLPLALSAGPLIYLPAYLDLPRVNDITTDWVNPPGFAAVARQRGEGANSIVYPGERFAQAQQSSYPDIKTLTIERSAEETFELVEDTVQRLRWKVAVTEPPNSRQSKAGILEAADITLIVGFADDISVRVDGSATRARVDVRSASRYGRHDLGQNAARVRRFLAELQARVDATGPAVAGWRPRSRASALVKRLKERNRQKAESRSGRDRAQPDAPRGRGQKETPR